MSRGPYLGGAGGPPVADGAAGTVWPQPCPTTAPGGVFRDEHPSLENSFSPHPGVRIRTE